MGTKLSYTQKNKLLLPLTFAAVLLCWFLAFSKTFEAVEQHAELERKIEQDHDIALDPQYQERKLAALDRILKSYKVDENGWSNELWMQVSSIAMKQKVGVDYAKTIPALENDTNSVGISERLVCYGNYVQLVKLVDTLEKTRFIGKLSGLQIKAPKPDLLGERATQCVLTMEFKGLIHL